MVPVYRIGNKADREAIWREIAENAVTGEELVTLSQAIWEWNRIVARLRRPAANDNKRGPHSISSGGRPADASQGN